MTINKNEVRLFISPTPVDAVAISDMTEGNALTAFQAINDWIEIGEVENLGEIGDAAQTIPFVSIGRQRVRKFKGARDAGDQTIVVGRDTLDSGQAALVTAEKTNYSYAFKMEMNDAKTPAYADSVMYYAGLVNTRRTGLGDGNTIVRRTFAVGVEVVIEVASAAIAVPTNITRPTILGTSVSVAAAVPLTAQVGSWTGAPTSYTYQWQNDVGGNGTFSNIVGATSSTYQPVSGDIGKAVRVQVKGVNSAGTAVAFANSLGVGLIVA